MITCLISILFAILFHPKLRHVSAAEPQSQSAASGPSFAYRFTTHTTMDGWNWNNGHNYYNQNYKQKGKMLAQPAVFVIAHSHQQQNYPMKMPPADGSHVGKYGGTSQFGSAASYRYYHPHGGLAYSPFAYPWSFKPPNLPPFYPPAPRTYYPTTANHPASYQKAPTSHYPAPHPPRAAYPPPAYYPPVNYPLNWNPLATNQPSFNPPPAARPPPSAAHPPAAANPPAVPTNNPQQQPNVAEPITADQQAASPRQGWVGQTGSPPASDSAALPTFDPNYKLGPEHLGNFIYYAMATDENPQNPQPRRNDKDIPDWFLPDANVDYEKYIKPLEDCGQAGWTKEKQRKYKVQTAAGIIEFYQTFWHDENKKHCLMNVQTKNMPGKLLRFYKIEPNQWEPIVCFAPNGAKIPSTVYETIWTNIYDAIYFHNGGPLIRGDAHQQQDDNDDDDDDDAHLVLNNAYPLSRLQLFAGINQEQIGKRIGAEAVDNTKLEGILQKHKKNLAFFYNQEDKTNRTLKTRKQILLDALSNAIGLVDSDSTDFIELIVTATNEEKDWYQSKDLCNQVSTVPEVNLDGPYKSLLHAICTTKRNMDFAVVEPTLKQKYALIDYFLYHGQEQLDEKKNIQKGQHDEAIQILAKTNYSQLRKIFKALPIERYIGNKGHFWQLVRALVDDVYHGRPCFFAKLLHSKLHKLLRSRRDKLYTSKLVRMFGNWQVDAHRDVQRILVGRFHIDLADIVEEFDRRFVGTPLRGILEKRAGKSTTNPYAAYLEIVNYLKPNIRHKNDTQDFNY